MKLPTTKEAIAAPTNVVLAVIVSRGDGNLDFKVINGLVRIDLVLVLNAVTVASMLRCARINTHSAKPAVYCPNRNTRLARFLKPSGPTVRSSAVQYVLYAGRRTRGQSRGL